MKQDTCGQSWIQQMKKKLEIDQNKRDTEIYKSKKN